MSDTPIMIAAAPQNRVATDVTIREVPLNDQTATLLAVHPGHIARAEPCPLCCHWVLPVSGARPDQFRTLDGKVRTKFQIAMTFEEWIVYHLHVVSHQGLDRRMQVNVA